MKSKKIEVPVLPGEKIYYFSEKFGIIEYKVSSLVINENGIFIVVSGNFDCGEEVSFSFEKIGEEIFLNESDAEEYMETIKCQTQN